MVGDAHDLEARARIVRYNTFDCVCDRDVGIELTKPRSVLLVATPAKQIPPRLPLLGAKQAGSPA